MFDYSKKVLDHFRHPRNSGALPATLPNLLTIEAGNPQSGKQLKFYVAHDGTRIIAVGYHVYGCVSTIATASMLSELLLNNSLEALRKLSAAEIFQDFELPQDRFNCALLAATLLKKLPL